MFLTVPLPFHQPDGRCQTSSHPYGSILTQAPSFELRKTLRGDDKRHCHRSHCGHRHCHSHSSHAGNDFQALTKRLEPTMNPTKFGKKRHVDSPKVGERMIRIPKSDPLYTGFLPPVPDFHWPPDFCYPCSGFSLAAGFLPPVPKIFMKRKITFFELNRAQKKL